MSVWQTEVGKPFIPGRISFQQGAWLEYTDGGPYLILSNSDFTAKEVDAVQKGAAEFGLYEISGILFFLYKFAGFGPWSDSPFSIRLYDGLGKSFDWSEEIADGQGLALHVMMVNSSNCILLAQRMIGLGTKFSRAFRAIILRQLERPFDKSAYNTEIDNIYRIYSSSELARRAGIKFRIPGR